MKMTIKPLDQHSLDQFMTYCRRYRFEHDESYLCESELRSFLIGEENPTFLLLNQKNKLMGGVSVKVMAHENNQLRGRIRLLHVRKPIVSLTKFRSSRERIKENYHRLIQTLQCEVKGLDHVFCLFPEDKDHIVEYLMEMGFVIDRYPCLLKRYDKPICSPVFSDGYFVRPFAYGCDEQIWLNLRNTIMSSVKGSEAPDDISVFQEYRSEEGEIDGGMLLLYHGDLPIGCARLVHEIENKQSFVFIDTIGIVPSYQHKGLGRQFLRYCLAFGQERRMNCAMLSVNAENKQATSLYIEEGFELTEIMTCLKYQFPLE